MSQHWIINKNKDSNTKNLFKEQISFEAWAKVCVPVGRHLESYMYQKKSDKIIII